MNRKIVSITGSAAVLVGLGVAGGIAIVSPAHKQQPTQPTQQIVRQVDAVTTPSPTVTVKPAAKQKARPAVVKPAQVTPLTDDPTTEAPVTEPATDPATDPATEPPQDPPATLGGNGQPLPTLPPPAPPISMNPAPTPEPGPGVTPTS